MGFLSGVRTAAIGLLLSLVLPPGTARSADRPLALDEAVQMALRKNPSLVIERESVAAANAAASGARGAYDPLLGLSGAWSRSTEPVNSAFSGAPAGRFAPETETTGAGASIDQRLPSGGALSLRAQGSRATTDGSFALLSPAYATDLGVELRQPLLRGLAIDPARASIRVARAGQRQADAGLRRTVSETVAAVETAYWGLVAARQGVAVLEDAVRLAEQQLAETRSRVQSGAAPGTELSQPRAELERRRGDLLADREALAQAENRLKLLILSDTDDALWQAALAPTDTATVAAAPLDAGAAQQRALVTRAEIEVARASLERSRATTALARNQVWPALDAVVSYDRFGLAGSANPLGPGGALPANLDGQLGQSFHVLGDGDFDATRVALVLGLPVFNRDARAAAAIARSAERQSEADLARVRNAIRAEVRVAAAAVETAGQRIEAARAGREAAEVQLSAERDRFATGLSTNFLVLTRQNDLSRARLDEIAARTDYQNARTELARATGSLLEERGIDAGATPR